MSSEFKHVRDPACQYFENMSQRCFSNNTENMKCETLKTLMRKCKGGNVEEVERITVESDEPSTNSTIIASPFQDMFEPPRRDRGEDQHDLFGFGGLFNHMMEFERMMRQAEDSFRFNNIFGEERRGNEAHPFFSHRENERELYRRPSRFGGYEGRTPPHHAQDSQQGASSRDFTTAQEDQIHQDIRRRNYNSVDI